MAYNILVVDDSAIVRAVIKKTLDLAGIDVGELYEAGNGKEGLAALQDNWIDLVLADINMPEMTGIEMVDKMAQDGLMKTVPVIIISTEGSQTRVEELKSKGVRAYIRKPFTPEIIREVIDQVLGAADERKDP